MPKTAPQHRMRRDRPKPKPEPGLYLPAPPGRGEKFRYYGPQMRGLFIFSLISFAGVAYGMSRLAMHNRWTMLLLILVCFQAIAVCVSVWSSTHERRFSLKHHRDRVKTWQPRRHPSVDVFLPSAGEPLYVLHNTYRHVARLNWPGELNIYVLDDSAREEVDSLAKAFGFHYLTRPNRGHLKKAGNLAYGFANSYGDFIHVFDADFAPRHDMTLEMLPYFDDPKVGIVQTPQYFDTEHERFNWLQRAAGSTQELFYRWVQPARDAVDAAICVGTNAIYRRAALSMAGGFAQIGHSEDVHTGVNLAKAGFATRYVPVNLAKGICPDNWDGFTNQQYRWCTGSMSLLAMPEFHKTEALNTRQKACFWTGFLYYIATAVAVFTMPIPVLLMVWFFPYDVAPMNYFTLAGTVLIWLTVMPFITDGRWTPIVLRVQALIGFCHALAIWDTMRGKTSAWVATGAAKRTPVARRVLRLIRCWVIPTQLAIWSGIGYGIARYGIEHYWVTVLFGLPGLYFLLPLALGARALPKPDPRDAELADMTLEMPMDEVRRKVWKT